TVPTPLEAEIYPGSKIEVRGYLYQPQRPKNPGQFDFKNYLKRNGAFAGISGREITVIQKNNWGFWRLRDRVINIHQKGLGSPEGELISSMVLGRTAVNLPYSIQDQFLKAGLAHILAASGFHVSLLLGLVLAITQQFKVSLRFAIGIGILILYVGLTGLQPSILRASLMGVAGLLGLLTERKVNSTQSLLIIATILLLINPLWILDLGFQFSFLATLGLIITLPILLNKLNFIPPTIASLIAVPIAIFPWIFPLQLFHFGTVATYSILLNVLVTPLAIFLILGGMISGFTGLLIPDLGSAIAQLLFYPTQLLITIVSGFNQLPGSYLLFGKLELWQLLIVITIIVFIWQSSQGKHYWQLALVSAIIIIAIPISYKQISSKQITIFAAEDPIIFIKNNSHTTLINCGGQDTIRYTVLPFLQQEGIQTIDNAIALSSENSWQNLMQEINIKQLFYNPSLETELRNKTSLPVRSQQRISLNQTLVQKRDLEIYKINPMLLKIKVGTQTWGFLSNATQSLPNIRNDLQEIDLLLWQGREIATTWLEELKPKSAIAISNQISKDVTFTLTQQQINFYLTGQQGAVQWTPQAGLKTWLN
ncbi:MAG: ComEC/Rec2 family competence protein, partial [Halothece sp. Uz-M2-17]|nr:ComEC/Rec2 family competence protein [Halothece sp. Uz-M2-17]